MLSLVKTDTLIKTFDFIKQFDINYIRNNNELSQIIKTLLEEYKIEINLDEYKNTSELIEFIKETIITYQDSDIVYEYYEKDYFENDYDVEDDEWKRICYHLNKCLMNGGDTRETIEMYLNDKEFRDIE